ncbi:hypothetical protein Tco_0702740 [Tanacetum coccineum]|uniref:Uncharacterized protein n=1 Tax=Tanacetum coccineum TaxID=301880 RepID=A0ABQ4XX33_9ASTR
METKDTLSSCSNSEEQQMQQIQDKAKKSCMVSFRQLHSHLKLLSNNDLKGTRTKSGFKRAFATLFGQDIETFTGTMFLYVDQLEKQLDKEEFQEIGSMAAFKVLETQFQMFIKSRMYLDDEFVVMTRNYFLQYTQLAIPEFRDTLIQHMESVKKSIDERAKHKEEYNSWVNERQMQTTEDKVDSSKALDASLVDTESSGTALKEQDTSSRSGNDAHADDADIRPIYDEEPMVEVQTTAEINIFATGQQHTEQPEFNNEGKVDQNAEQCHDTCPLPATLTDNQTTELSNQSLESENIHLKKTVAQFQKDFLRMEAHCVNLELKYQNQALKEGQHGQFLKVKSNEAKERESDVAKLHHMIAPGSSRSPSLKDNNAITKPVEHTSVAKKPERQIPKRHRSSIKQTSVVHEKTMTPRSCLRWKPTGKIFKTVGLKWIPTRKIFTSSITKADSEPTNGSNDDITNQYECKQTLDVSAGTLSIHAGTSLKPTKEGLRVWLLKRLISEKSGLQGIFI